MPKATSVNLPEIAGDLEIQGPSWLRTISGETLGKMARAVVVADKGKGLAVVVPWDVYQGWMKFRKEAERRAIDLMRGSPINKDAKPAEADGPDWLSGEGGPDAA